MESYVLEGALCRLSRSCRGFEGASQTPVGVSMVAASIVWRITMECAPDGYQRCTGPPRKTPGDGGRGYGSLHLETGWKCSFGLRPESMSVCDTRGSRELEILLASLEANCPRGALGRGLLSSGTKILEQAAIFLRLAGEIVHMSFEEPSRHTIRVQDKVLSIRKASRTTV